MSLLFGLTYRLGWPLPPTKTPDPVVMDLVRRRPPGRFLDLGCGDGRVLVPVAMEGWRGVGVEKDEVASELARKRLESCHVLGEVINQDLTRLGSCAALASPVDVLWDGGCYHMLKEWEREVYARLVTELTVPGGTLLIAGITAAPWPFSRFHVDAAELIGRLPLFQLERTTTITTREMETYVTPRFPVTWWWPHIHFARFELMRIPG